MGFVLREGFADYVNSIRLWEEMNALFYNNSFAADAQFAIGYTYEAYQRDYAKARESYERLLNLYPNSPMQNQVREALLRISNKK
jgi:tetratricopeptide (TPR) repeat protein